MKRVLLFSFIACLLFAAGCKSRRVAEGWNGYRQWQEMAGIASRFSRVASVDTLVGQWQRQLSGHITLWSPPDSVGRQYIQAEIVVDSGETAGGQLYRYTHGSDTTHVMAGGRQHEEAESAFYEEKTRDSRPVSRLLLAVIFSVLGLGAVFLWLKKKNICYLT